MSNSLFFSTPNAPKNTASNSSGGKGLVEQAIYGIIIVFIVYVVLFSTEMIYLYFNRLHLNRTELLP